MIPRRIREAWAAKPLTARLVVLIVGLLSAGLVLTGTVMIGLLQRHLVSQIDEQLITSAGSMAQQTNQSTSTGNSSLPSLFYIRREVIGQSAEIHYSADTLRHSGTPNIPTLLEVGQRADTTTGWTNPVTVGSSIPGQSWRAIAVPLAVSGSDDLIGVLTIALPLTDVQHTLRYTALYISMSALFIVLIGGSAGHYLVRRALLPLREIEATAGRIAAGDLTQRVTPHPTTTEVGSLALSLNTMLTQVESSFAAREESERKIRRFVSDASHELRTPLAAISGYCELYTMGGVPTDRTDEVVGRIRSEATRMGSLVEDLLTLARLDEGRPLEISEIDLTKMADNASFDLRALDPTRSVTVTGLSTRSSSRANPTAATPAPPMTLTVPADRDRIQQVFTNLIGNIVRYTPKGSPVEIAVGISDGHAVVEFRDHGPGIAATDRERVFERFYRTENSRARSLGGSGLGLAIVSGILNAHHGQAHLSKTPGGGLTVRIELPLT